MSCGLWKGHSLLPPTPLHQANRARQTRPLVQSICLDKCADLGPPQAMKGWVLSVCVLTKPPIPWFLKVSPFTLPFVSEGWVKTWTWHFGQGQWHCNSRIFFWFSFFYIFTYSFIHFTRLSLSSCFTFNLFNESVHPLSTYEMWTKMQLIQFIFLFSLFPPSHVPTVLNSVGFQCVSGSL